MRRSVREAIVGFTLIAAVAAAGGFWMWLQGINLSRRNWTIRVSFPDAAGLADRSAVTYRGIVIGNVRSVKATAAAVVAELEITDPELRLPRPVLAQVEESSLLGGDAVVALLSPARSLPPGTPGPRSPQCNNRLTICPGAELKGQSAATITTVTATMQRLLDQADQQQLVSLLAKTTRSFDATSKEANKFLGDGQQLLADLKVAVAEAKPTLRNLEASSAHVRNLTAALDNPKTVSELKTTVTNAEKLTARWDAVGGDVNRLTADPQFMDGMRSVAIGLGKFFDELYPAQTGAPQGKAPKPR
jgi:phospholipid/cholesterol/gamma-HCH transport system substrate-binding protein